MLSCVKALPYRHRSAGKLLFCKVFGLQVNVKPLVVSNDLELAPKLYTLNPKPKPCTPKPLNPTQQTSNHMPRLDCPSVSAETP